MKYQKYMSVTKENVVRVLCNAILRTEKNKSFKYIDELNYEDCIANAEKNAKQKLMIVSDKVFVDETTNIITLIDTLDNTELTYNLFSVDRASDKKSEHIFDLLRHVFGNGKVVMINKVIS